MPTPSIRRATSLVIAIAAAVLVALVVGAAAGRAQTAQTSVAYANGTSAEAVDVTVNGGVAATGLAFADATASTVSDAGSLAVEFGDGSSVTFDAAGSVAYTVVSGFGEADATASAYPVAVVPIPDGQAGFAVWNATTETQLFSVDGSDPFELLAGEGVDVQYVAADTTVVVQVGVDTPAEESLALPADSYTDVFAVFDGTSLGLASAVIPSMTDLLAAIGETPPTPTVPDVVGQTAEDATQALLDAGYVVGTSEAPSDSVAPGLVISTDPAAGTELASGSTVTIVVSTGPATVAVPDVVGQPAADAQAALEAVGLTATLEERSDNEVEEGLVIETNPRAGVEVAAGTAVVVVVSTGPEDVEVPDLLGLAPDEALAETGNVGLELEVVEDPDEPDPEGLVVEQDPVAGEMVPAGSTVTVLLSPAIGEPWTSIRLDPDRIMTAGGINFEVGSVSEASILTTDLAASAVVDDRGYWVVEIDTTSLDPNLAYEVRIRGTAADGSAYERVFDLPPPGETVDEPQEEEGIPPVVFIVFGLILVVVVLVGILLVRETIAMRRADAD